jgi:hypothetical protein
MGATVSLQPQTCYQIKTQGKEGDPRQVKAAEARGAQLQDLTIGKQ